LRIVRGSSDDINRTSLNAAVSLVSLIVKNLQATSQKVKGRTISSLFFVRNAVKGLTVCGYCAGVENPDKQRSAPSARVRRYGCITSLAELTALLVS
jgi:hypothetical protein